MSTERDEHLMNTGSALYPDLAKFADGFAKRHEQDEHWRTFGRLFHLFK
jgi:hypothetical protein